ncbi:ankyrin repeat domain-containing protein, partial [archaeon]
MRVIFVAVWRVRRHALLVCAVRPPRWLALAGGGRCAARVWNERCGVRVCERTISPSRAAPTPARARATAVRRERPHFAHATRCSTHPALVTAQHRACGSDNMAATTARAEQNTALLRAAAGGDGLEVRALLDAGANVDALDDDGNTALLKAVLGGHADVMELLLAAGARTDVLNADGLDALHAALWDGRTALAHRMWTHACDAGFSAVHAAALGQGGGDATEAVLPLSPECVSAQDACGFTPLHVAAITGNAAFMAQLLTAGAACDAREEGGVTPLHVACSRGHEACVSALLEAGADMDAKSVSGWTPLHVAC